MAGYTKKDIKSEYGVTSGLGFPMLLPVLDRCQKPRTMRDPVRLCPNTEAPAYEL